MLKILILYKLHKSVWGLKQTTNDVGSYRINRIWKSWRERLRQEVEILDCDRQMQSL